MSTPIPFNYNGKSITFIYQGKTTILDKSSAQFPAVIDALKKGEWDLVASRANLRVSVTVATNGRVRILDDNTVYLDDRLVHDALVDRMLEMLSEGFGDVKPLMYLLERIDANPLQSAKDELYLFLEATNLPITPDGHFLGYKIVSPDYLDLYTKQISNVIGSVVTMPRDKVDPDRHVTCSHGLHVCSEAYLPKYGSESAGDRVVVVKVDPADVVSIPSDYNNSKMRVCRYEVVDELANWRERLREHFINKYGSPAIEADATYPTDDANSDYEENRFEDDYDNEDEDYDNDESTDDGDSTSEGSELDSLLENLPEKGEADKDFDAEVIEEAQKHEITAEKVLQIRKVRTMGKEGFNKQAIADTTGLSRRQVGRILSGENWSEVK